uniref:Lon-like protease helical domain-containing protein n=1 Tax=Piscinibacter sp. TaxID=1903157 RepID=UPI00355A2B84
MTARTLTADELTVRCDAASLGIERASAGTPAAPIDEHAAIVGQERARAAVEFGIAMPHAGYHLFVAGPPGAGKKTLARRAIAAHVAVDGIRRSDWVYVNNFERPHQPVALQLPLGRG